MSDQCAWTHEGRRCAFPGAVSHSTVGGGPWYCGKHARCSDPYTGGKVVDASIAYRPTSREDAERAFRRRLEAWLPSVGLARAEGEARTAYVGRLRAFVRRAVSEIGAGPKAASNAWARRILDRYADREPIADIALRAACDVLKMDVEAVRASVLSVQPEEEEMPL